MKTTLQLLSIGLVSLVVIACGRPPEYDLEPTPAPRVIRSADTPIDELMDKSGANFQVVQLPRKLMVTADQQIRKGVVYVDEIRRILMETYNPGDMRERAREHLQSSLNASDVEQTLAWLNTDLGKKVSVLEIQGSRPEAHNASMNHYSELRKDQQRVDLIRQLDKAKQASKQEVELVLAAQQAMMIAMGPALPAQARITEKEFKKRSDEMRPDMEEQYQRVVEATFLYNYRSLSNEEVREYIAFAGSDVGRKYHTAMAEAIQLVVNYGSGLAGAQIAEFMAKKSQ